MGDGRMAFVSPRIGSPIVPTADWSGSEHGSPHPRIASRHLRIEPPDRGHLPGPVPAHPAHRRRASGEVAYIVDTDFFLEDDPSYRDSNGVLRALQRFNGQSGRLFRSMLQPRLHDAMGPTKITS